MKYLFTPLIAAGLLAAVPAEAGPFDWSIGISSRGYSGHGYYESRCPPPPPCDSRAVVTHRTVTHRSSYRPSRSYRSTCPPRGRYETIERRVWVEGYWKHERRSCGRVVRHWVPGYYKTVCEKVWVEY